MVGLGGCEWGVPGCSRAQGARPGRESERGAWVGVDEQAAAVEIKRFTCPIADFRGDPVLGVTEMTSIWKAGLESR